MLRTACHPLPLPGPEQLKKLHQVLKVWNRSPPLEPLKFEKVGAQAGVRGKLGRLLGKVKS